jgi:hypothetical protein
MGKKAILSNLRLSTYVLSLMIAYLFVDSIRAQEPIAPPQSGSVLDQSSGSDNGAKDRGKSASIEMRYTPAIGDWLDSDYERAREQALKDLKYYKGLGEIGRDYFFRYAEDLMRDLDWAHKAKELKINEFFRPRYEHAKYNLDLWEKHCVESQDQSQILYALNWRDKAEEVLEALKGRNQAKESYEYYKKEFDEQEELLHRVELTKDLFSNEIDRYRYHPSEGVSSLPASTDPGQESLTNDDSVMNEISETPLIGLSTPNADKLAEGPSSEKVDAMTEGLPPLGHQVMRLPPSSHQSAIENYAVPARDKSQEMSPPDPGQEGLIHDGSVMNEISEFPLAGLSVPNADNTVEGDPRTEKVENTVTQSGQTNAFDKPYIIKADPFLAQALSFGDRRAGIGVLTHLCGE